MLYPAPKEGLSLENIWKGLLRPWITELFYEDSLDLRFEEITTLIRSLNYGVLTMKTSLLHREKEKQIIEKPLVSLLWVLSGNILTAP